MDRTASPGLRLERVAVRERAVVAAGQLVHPGGVAVHRRRAESLRAPPLHVAADVVQARLEARPVAEQAVVVVQAVEADLAPAAPDAFEIGVGDRIPAGAQVPARHAAVAALDGEQRLDALQSERALHVVGQHPGEPLALRPQADDRDAVDALRAQRGAQRGRAPAQQHVLVRPRRERHPALTARARAPQRELRRPRDQRLDPVEGAQRAPAAPVAAVVLVDVPGVAALVDGRVGGGLGHAKCRYSKAPTSRPKAGGARRMAAFW